MTAQREPTESQEATFRYMGLQEVERAYELVMLAFGEQWPNLPIKVSRLEHLRWKLSGPRAVPTDPEIAEVGGRIVGYIGGSTRQMWVKGELARGWYGGDYCIHPDFQGRGLIGAWTDWRDQQHELHIEPDLFGISEGSTHPRLIRFSRRREGRALVANKVDRLTLPLDVGAIARGGDGTGGRASPRTLLRGGKTMLQMLITRLRWRPPSEAAPALRLQTVEQFDERADRLWEQAREVFDFAVVRDREHLNWRYCDPRAGVYRVRAVDDGDELLGFMVTGAFGRAAQIVDVLIVPGAEGALRLLVEDAIAQAREDDASSLTVMMPRHHPYRETFLRHGSIKSNRVGATGFSRKHRSTLGFLERDRKARLHVALGDDDHV